MGISFDRPLWWLVLPGILILAWYWRRPWLLQARAWSRQAYRREWRRLVLRLLVFLLLAAALAGPRWLSVVDHQAIILALDASASMGAAVAEGEHWLRQVLAAKPARDQAGVIAFGEKALVEVPVTEKPIFRRLETVPGAAGSNFSAALSLARGLLPAEARRRVVLISDGRDTSSEAVMAARELSQAGIRVDVLPLGVPGEADIRLDGLELPVRAYEGETSIMQISATASQATAATVVIERNNELLASREINLLPGSNRLTLPLSVGGAGLHRYRVRLVGPAALDSLSANNEAGIIQQVLGPPRVLLVAAAVEEASALRQALEANQVEVEIALPPGIPQDPTGWAHYSAVFLVNIPAHDLGREAMQQLESYVRDGGGGLLMSGGPDAFGPGGYAGTPIEKVLPVEMQISGRGELPSLGLMLVIDKSGSMDGYAGGASKINLAKEAAARAAGMLTPRDRVGVIAFDSSPWEVVPLGLVNSQEVLRQQIGSIYAGGGTEVYPALAVAYGALATAPTRVKHIILLTDGRSASGGPYMELIKALNEAGITLSTVAVGEDADGGMLKALAELGRGRFYATAEATTIPTIFTRETVLATRSYAVNEHFLPRAVAGGPLLTGIEAVPPLDGYITATPKPMATVELISPRGEPILTSWQYGLGRSVAWTPDFAGRWSSSWVNSPLFSRLAGNIITWLLPADEQGEIKVRAGVQEENGNRKIIIDVDDPGQWQQVRDYQARVVGPDGTVRVVLLQAAGPGVYTGELPAGETGAYLININHRHILVENNGAVTSDLNSSQESNKEQEENSGRQDGTAPVRTSLSSGNGETAFAPGVPVARAGVVVPYPTEYHRSGIDLEELAAIAAAGGGEILARPQEAFAANLAPVRASREMAWLLLLLAGVLWFFDVAQRRFTWSREEKAELLRAWRTPLAAGGRRLVLFFRSKEAAPGEHSIRRLKNRSWGHLTRLPQVYFPAGGPVVGSKGREQEAPGELRAAARSQTGGQQIITTELPKGAEQGGEMPPAEHTMPPVPAGRGKARARDPRRTTARLLAIKKQRRNN